MSFSIIVASHGDDRWRRLALSRALPSAQLQEGAEVLCEHDPVANRAIVRNRLADRATGEWLVFLDADDELAPGYTEALARALEQEADGTHPLLLTPAVSYIHGRRVKPPTFWPVCELRSGNWMVVGTALQKTLFDQVGQWKHLGGTGVTNEYDDWHLWCRCSQAGARPVKVPDAIYRAYVQVTSAHRTATRQRRLDWHREVEKDVWGEVTV